MIRLVPIAAAHLPVAAAIHKVCFTDFWEPGAIADLLAMPGCLGWIALADDDDPAGMILARTAADEAEVLTIAVLPPFRRKGVGGCLLTAAAGAAVKAGAGALFLEVAGGNDKALALYARHGFHEVGRRPRYYGGTTDALILRRDLS